MSVTNYRHQLTKTHKHKIHNNTAHQCLKNINEHFSDKQTFHISLWRFFHSTQALKYHSKTQLQATIKHKHLKSR